MAASIYLKSITKKINNTTVIANLDIGLQKGDTLALIGNNDSGKSTLLKLLSGILDSDSGDIFLNGEKLSSKNYNLRKSISYVPEYIDFDGSLSIYENLYIHLRLNKEISLNEANKEIFHWSDVFNFKDILYSQINDIALGKLRLIQLIRALLTKPNFLILDQPTKGLDPEYKHSIWDILKRVFSNTTIVFVSHDFDEISNYSNRIAFLNEGKIRLNGSINEIMKKTSSYGFYEISFKTHINDVFLKKMKENNDLYHLKVIDDKKIQFYCPNKEIFFEILKDSLNYDLIDIKNRPFDLKDVFLSQTKKVNE